MPRRLKVQGQLCESILDCDRVVMPVHQGVHWVSQPSSPALRSGKLLLQLPASLV